MTAVFVKAIQYLEGSQGIFPGFNPRQALTIEDKRKIALVHCIHSVVNLETFRPLFTPI